MRAGSSDTRTVTRTELFNLVWNEPMRTLAPKFGLSDVGLAKLCRREAIPLPPMGYWAREPKRRRRPTLPPAAIGHNDTLKIVPSQIRHMDVSADLPEDILAMMVSLDEGSEIVVPASCPRAYAMFERWDRVKRQDRFTMSESDRRPSLSAIEKRRRRILYTIIRQIEQWNGRVVAADPDRFKIELGSDELEFTLREPSNRVQRPLTQDEMRWYPDRDSMPDLKPSGKLRLLVESYFNRPIQKSWGDLEERPLESRLREVLVGLLIGLAESRRRRLELEEWHAQRAREEQERLAAEERRRAEQARRQDLKEEAAAWLQAARIREYVAAQLSKAGQTNKLNSQVEAWVEWAIGVADSIDPLCGS